MINIPKGTKDVLPADAYKWQYVEGVARETAKLYNLKEIRTPVFEHTELFLRGVGDTTDIVTKEMYTFRDKGDRSITLKPEGTAGAARSFIENGLGNGVLPAKMYYITPVFRYERPQAGRLREFHQFGVRVRRKGRGRGCGSHFPRRFPPQKIGIKGQTPHQFHRLSVLPRRLQQDLERIFRASPRRALL